MCIQHFFYHQWTSFSCEKPFSGTKRRLASHRGYLDAMSTSYTRGCRNTLTTHYSPPRNIPAETFVIDVSCKISFIEHPLHNGQIMEVRFNSGYHSWEFPTGCLAKPSAFLKSPMLRPHLYAGTGCHAFSAFLQDAMLSTQLFCRVLCLALSFSAGRYA